MFTTDFIFDPVPPVKSDFYLALLIVFGLLVVAGLFISIFVKGDMRKILRGYITPLLSGGILGNIHLFARYEGLPWLASRFFLIIVSVAFLAWLVALAVRLPRYLPKLNEEKRTQARYDRYLPKQRTKRS